ncbi:peptidyl-prolyl cis-trans isomerase-like 3 isoform X1 [Clinocottus analis]|uniref:peptidyl-prolyl cis-trans isomerase-like 3 isoform X1 n=1 Tax=Clinocottus analis TaxID=304258 RepID=UPI0035C1F002
MFFRRTCSKTHRLKWLSPFKQTWEKLKSNCFVSGHRKHASGFYAGCVFHRNIKGFMVQTGDPTGTGKGGTSIWGRKYEDEFSEHLKHNVRGVVSMANNGPNTNGSQFFFTYAKQPHLDMKYTVFGKIIDGLETLDELEKLPVNEKTFRPLTETRIKDVTIHANPFAG